MPLPRRQIHEAWIVLGAVVFVVFCTSGLRGSFGVFIKPLEAEFGWTRSVLSGVASQLTQSQEFASYLDASGQSRERLEDALLWCLVVAAPVGCDRASGWLSGRSLGTATRDSCRR